MAGLVAGLLTEQAIATRNPTDGVVYHEDTILLDYNFDSTLLEIDIPASAAKPVYLLEVLHIVQTAFAGGTPSIDVGDGSTAAKYIASATITEVTAGNLARSVVGQKLVANAKVLVTLSASLSAGAGTLVARIFRPA